MKPTSPSELPEQPRRNFSDDSNVISVSFGIALLVFGCGHPVESKVRSEEIPWSGQLRQELSGPCENSHATVRYADGRVRSLLVCASEFLADPRAGLASARLPMEDCRVELDLDGGRDGPVRHVVREIRMDSPNGSPSSPDLDASEPGGTPTVDGNGIVAITPRQDAWIGPEDNNSGLGSELRLYEGGSMAVLDFGNLRQVLHGRMVERAELVLHGWKGDIPGGEPGIDERIDLGTVPLGWSEGFGDWYFFDGSPENGFERAYSLWPGFKPPHRAANPAFAPGIRWSDDGGVRTDFRAIRTFVPDLDEGIPYAYPTAEQARVVRLDVTESVRELIASGASRGFALRRATKSPGPRQSIDFYSKDHAPSVSPALRIRFAD